MVEFRDTFVTLTIGFAVAVLGFFVGWAAGSFVNPDFDFAARGSAVLGGGIGLGVGLLIARESLWRRKN